MQCTKYIVLEENAVYSKKWENVKKNEEYTKPRIISIKYR